MGGVFSKKTSSKASPRPSLPEKYCFIPDNFNSIEQVTEALRGAGLEASNLIVGIDCTKSNEWTGKHSFNGRSLHAISDSFLNPYEQAIQIVGETLSSFDDDNLIPCFGFGDVSTGDHAVFSFYPNDQPCNGFTEVLSRYREIIPHIRLSGPTSFAPIIRAAINIVEESGGQYHVLLIIADGQVTRSVDTSTGSLSPQEQETIASIVEASKYPLSIVLVGVGDGPWDAMKQFDDRIPRRAFDNFQFVNFTSIMAKNLPKEKRQAEFALAALMEIPFQYQATMEYGILNQKRGKMSNCKVLPPPGSASRSMPSFAGGSNLGSSFSRTEIPNNSGPVLENQFCPVCLTQPKDMAFGCGHQTCRECAANLVVCPLCRQHITNRLRLYV